MTRTTVSIAMTTCNGAAYLQEQLDSFLSQTRLPDELVVCDDVSKDDTVGILERFAAGAPFPVRIRINESNLGSTRNFDRAIGLCRGDVICLADQDDVWCPRKVERVLQTLADTGIDMVFSDADVIDASGRHLGYRLWATKGFTRALRERWLRGQAFDVLLERRVVTGAAMAFRARLRDSVSPISPAWVHDAWIALLVAGCYRGAFMPEPLMNYRQHAGNQIGARRSSPWDMVKGFSVVTPQRERRARLQRRIEAYQAIQARFVELNAGTNVQRRLQALLDHLQRRVEAIESSGVRRFRPVLTELAAGRYRKYSQGSLKAAADLFGK